MSRNNGKIVHKILMIMLLFSWGASASANKADEANTNQGSEGSFSLLGNYNANRKILFYVIDSNNIASRKSCDSPDIGRSCGDDEQCCIIGVGHWCCDSDKPCGTPESRCE